jgi:hypothetical protein
MPLVLRLESVHGVAVCTLAATDPLVRIPAAEVPVGHWEKYGYTLPPGAPQQYDKTAAFCKLDDKPL